ncbi:MAG: radical SAM protein, partial [Alphaproteobacteria bacterium]
ARRGLLVRHLIMPNDLAGSEEAFRFLAAEISRDTYLNIMGQYHPCHEARQHDDLRRRPTRDEMNRAYEMAWQSGLYRLDKR